MVITYLISAGTYNLTAALLATVLAFGFLPPLAAAFVSLKPVAVKRIAQFSSVEPAFFQVCITSIPQDDDCQVQRVTWRMLICSHSHNTPPTVVDCCAGQERENWALVSPLLGPCNSACRGDHHEQQKMVARTSSTGSLSHCFSSHVHLTFTPASTQEKSENRVKHSRVQVAI